MARPKAVYVSAEHQPAPSPGEQETWAEHRAALEATLFAPEEGPGDVVLELRDGVLHRLGR